MPSPTPPEQAAASVAENRRELRRVLGSFPTGITVMTAGRDMPRGMTANSFTSVSLEPPLVLVCVSRTAAMHDLVLEEKAFALSVLSADQEQIARRFADRSRPRGTREFEGVAIQEGGRTGAPVLLGSLAWFECGLEAVYEGGDHSVFLASVLDAGRVPTEEALLFYKGAFHRVEGPTV
nr:flavin reductase family protein [Streptomyces sp. NRRL B-1677]